MYESEILYSFFVFYLRVIGAATISLLAILIIAITLYMIVQESHILNTFYTICIALIGISILQQTNNVTYFGITIIGVVVISMFLLFTGLIYKLRNSGNTVIEDAVERIPDDNCDGGGNKRNKYTNKRQL